MSLFFLTAFLVYTAMHIYTLLKAKKAFRLTGLLFLLLASFMLFQLLSPFLVHYTEKYGFDTAARVVAYVGYTWMGLIFLFVSASLVVDICRLVIFFLGRVTPWDISAFTPSGRTAFLIPFIISLCITAYGFREASHIETERIVIRSPKIPAEPGKVRIVQVSDVHIGVILREGHVRKIVNAVKREKPDIFVSTGDLVDGQVCRYNGITELLKSVTAPYGKYAITGNHEYYAGIEQALKSTEQAGFTLLRGETAAGIIAIAGVDDPAGKDFGLYRDVPEKSLLNSLPQSKFRLLLKHRPLVDRDSAALFDLQLSGHTHKGQIFPFTILIHYLYPLDAGLGRLSQGSMLYVSRGTGTWGPPIRFLAPPEITVIDLVHDSGDKK
ncbi:MAG: metallophosphoesterase [Nitrospirales bacterium]|nr:metallophosphoesterase [Nitrospirales bacterium]